MSTLKSLITRITMLCCLIVTVLVVGITSCNLYAVSVVRDQVLSAKRAMLKLYVGQIDGAMNSTTSEMLRLVGQDFDLNSLCIYDPGSMQYKLAIQRSLNKVIKSTVNNKDVDAMYLYQKAQGLLLSYSETDPYEKQEQIAESIGQLSANANNGYTYRWNVAHLPVVSEDQPKDAWQLTNEVYTTPALVMGAVIQAEDVIKPLQSVGAAGSYVLLYSTAGKLLTHTALKSTLVARIGAEILCGTTTWNSLYDEQTRTSYIALAEYSAVAPVYYVIVIPQDSILQQLPFLLSVNRLLPGLLLAVTLLLTWLIRRELHRPLHNLTGAMEQVAGGDLSVRLPPGHSTEFAFVNQHFNGMVGEIETLKIDVYEQTLRTQRAELRHLQAQINPHFYQNTLNLIYNLAALRQWELIQKTALHLADFFRFIMRSGNEMVALRDELRHVNNYMELQKIRYPNILDYIVDAPEELMDFRVLPLLIQPFVENSVIHGFTANRRQFVVRVKVEREEDRVRIEITDNGSGFDEQTLAALTGLCAGTADGNSPHIGIWNVIMRLKRHYGNSAQLELRNLPAEGACVRIVLPDLQGGTDDEFADR